ncbi:MAG: hypothetical protein IPF57_03685 [Gammaproteobacteria bacterium]|nr:hypothetical protein [Gammaproteobacteria bacterium]
MKLRVVQWSVGNVGRRSIIAIHANPHLELVGCCVRGADKAGQDAGVLAGIGPIGIVAGSDVEALLALEARLRELQRPVGKPGGFLPHPRARRQHRHDLGFRHRAPPRRRGA